MNTLSIIGTGSYLPEYRESNEAFVDRTGMDTSDAWIREKSGIESRPLVRGPHLATDIYAGGDLLEQEFAHPTADMGTIALQQALDMADMEPDQLDALIVGTWTPDYATPGAQDLIAQTLDIEVAGSDASAACASFTYALAYGGALLDASWNRYKTIAVVGSETMSRHLDWNNRGNAFLFADGAGAMILQQDEHGTGRFSHFEGGVLGPETLDYLFVPRDGTVEMDGPAVYRTAIPAAASSLKNAIPHPQELGLLIPHQANRRITSSIQKKLGLTDTQVVDVIDHTGNSSSATIPIALDEAMRAGRLQDHDSLAMIGFGAGMTYGTLIMNVGELPQNL